jgi:pimeloyl-ACP methyl ester carboxylesterase
MPHITGSDGACLHYEEAGQGNPLVLLHGWTFSGRFFHGSVPALAEHARVVTPDWICAAPPCSAGRSARR